ncbi:DgyrCDS14822 [Dimorphilus gyrociliatus]|uniref:DgyrCDS14822 n=1 Tax=Dimorphilus gyrociliatus TaxID=2664684 RepID=A0A7I8WEZ3_9ANNE|nr:DgyrCDS14822 [Dimorphilus gyrociliatus]
MGTISPSMETIVYGTKLKDAAIVVFTTIERNRIGYTKGLEIRDKWENFINEQRLLAVDYIVHLAEGYSRSVYGSREERVKDMLTQVGISVLPGAITLGASFFLLLEDLLFFVEFGAFMFATIGFSILWALGFFSTILAMFGPQNSFGSLKSLNLWIGKKFKGKQYAISAK